jgi:hypothetical protein
MRILLRKIPYGNVTRIQLVYTIATVTADLWAPVRNGSVLKGSEGDTLSTACLPRLYYLLFNPHEMFRKPDLFPSSEGGME